MSGVAHLCPVSAAHEALTRFVAWPSPEAADAAALWIAHCHLLPAFETSPRLALSSPEPGSGKSRALEIMAGLAPRPMHTFSATPAYLLRRIGDEEGPPTVFLDETDAIFHLKAGGEAEGLRAALNAGYRRGAMAGRCVIVGKRVETEELPCFAPVALAGLGKLPETITSRAINIGMRKRRADEVVDPYRVRDDEAGLHAIRDRLAGWATLWVAKAGRLRPTLPDGVVDRTADVWEPIVTAADLAGGDWPGRARAAAVHFLRAAADSSPSLAVRLLADIRATFDRRGCAEVATVDLLSDLLGIDEAPWPDLRGKPITAAKLAKLLEPFAVRSDQIWIAGRNVRGFRKADFADAWERYLPASEPGQ